VIQLTFMSDRMAVSWTVAQAEKMQYARTPVQLAETPPGPDLPPTAADVSLFVESGRAVFRSEESPSTLSNGTSWESPATMASMGSGIS
jgi:hypothetical protein